MGREQLTRHETLISNPVLAFPCFPAFLHHHTHEHIKMSFFPRASSISSSRQSKQNKNICRTRLTNQTNHQLGIPTANIPISGLTVGGHDDVASGVYYGWAGLSPSPATGDKPAVFPMVMSIGWNPFYKNSVRSVEVHIMHKFEQDFYGSHMNLVILGFIRPEYDYVSLESLVEDIHTDINVARDSLARDAYARFKEERGLVEFGGKSDNAD
ncbi:hypothetical protein Q7P36_001275 [Cladosporium allicinum]